MVAIHLTKRKLIRTSLMTLKEMLYDITYMDISQFVSAVMASVCFDPRLVGPKDLLLPAAILTDITANGASTMSINIIWTMTFGLWTSSVVKR